MAQESFTVETAGMSLNRVVMMVPMVVRMPWTWMMSALLSLPRSPLRIENVRASPLLRSSGNLLLGGGMTLLWQRLSQGTWWTWIAIVGNAYIGTSLVTASLLFYQDRYTRWQEALAELLATQREQAA